MKKSQKQSYSKNSDIQDQIKRVQSTVHFNEEYKLEDISCLSKGMEEDEFFLKNPQILNIVRRGNTDIIIQNKRFIGRKGLQKFFDLKHDYFNDDAQLKQIDILAKQEVLEKLTEFPIKVIKMSKANGENCQLSFIKELDSFIICSKNVSICCRNSDDLKNYQDQRYYFAKIIGEIWFQIYENIEKKDQLKDFLNYHTFIGEYCGNQLHQHLVKYFSIQLLFYAIVNKNSTENCLLVEQSEQIFKQFNLQMVSYKDYGIFQDRQSLLQQLKQISLDVNQSSIELDQEGSVIYFENDKNIKLCKLKTLEYRIYRKLREKIKKLQKINYQILLDKLIKETKELCEIFQPLKQLQYYFLIANLALQFAQKIQPSQIINQISDKFINFLSIVIYCEATNTEPQINMLYNQQLLDEIQKNTWSSYYNYNKQYSLVKQQQQSEQIQENFKKLFVIVPITIPGCGKTHLFNFLSKLLDEKKMNYKIISSDECRSQCMQQLSNQNKKLNKEQLFEKSTKPATNKFYSLIDQFIKYCKNKQNVLILDKNHPPSSHDSTYGKIDQFGVLHQIDIKYLNICQKLGNYQIENINLPFSLEFMITCIHRVQNRQNHQTLNGDQLKSMEILFFFIKFYKNYKFRLNEELLEINFINQQKLQFSQEFINAFNLALSKNNIQNFYDEYCQQQLQIDNPNDYDVQSQAQKIINLISQQENPQIQQQEFSQSLEKQFTEQQIQSKSQSIDKFPVFLALDIIHPDFEQLTQQFIEKHQINQTHLNFVKDFHVTLLFCPLVQNYKEHPIYVQFKENQNESFKLEGIVYIPNMILIGIVSNLQSKSFNQFPHITLMTNNQWKPKMSNIVLQSISKIMKQDNIMGFEGNIKYINNLKILQQQFNANIYKIQNLEVQSVTKFHF